MLQLILIIWVQQSKRKILRDLRFWRQCFWKTISSGMLLQIMYLPHLSIEEAVEKRNEESLKWG